MQERYKNGMGPRPHLAEANKATRFKPGNKGRPKGRKSIVGTLRDLMHKEVQVKIDGQMQTVTVDEAISMALIKKATSGDIRAITAIIDHIDGKALQRNEHTGPEGAPIQHNVQIQESAEHWNARMIELIGGNDDSG
jgi:hypothetical protein